MLRALLMAPVLLLLVLFALSNQQLARLALWPTDLSAEVPVSLAVLVIAAVFFIVGALIASSGTWGVRRRLRRADRTVQVLEQELAAIRARPIGSSAALSPPD